MERVRLSLATKIFLGFMVLLASFALLAAVSMSQIRAISEDLKNLKEGQIALARHAARLDTDQKSRFRDLRGLTAAAAPTQKLLLRIDIGYFPEIIPTTLDEIRDTARAHARAARPREGDEAVAFAEGIVARADRIEALHGEVDAITRGALERLEEDLPLDDEVKLLGDLETKLETQTYELDGLINAAMDRAVRRAVRDERRAWTRIIATTGAALVIGLFMTLLAARSLAPIRPLVRYARAISRGDYDQKLRLAGDNELGSLADELRLMARSRKDREDELDRQKDALQQAYRRVDELKRYHESIVRSLRTAIVVTDTALRVTSTNRAAETHWGLTASRVHNKTLWEIDLLAPLKDTVGPLEGPAEPKEPRHVPAVPLQDRRADVTVAPLQNERGAVLGLVVALEDVTEAVQTKDALLRSERLATIGRMSAHVTHEIRNPLSSIGLNTEMLRDLMKDGGRGTEREAAELCQAISDEIDRLAAITDAYLKFARLPRPRLSAEKLGPLLEALTAFVHQDLDSSGIHLSVDVPPDLPEVLVDADQIRQALLNLLRNAMEAMPDGGTIRLQARATDEAVEIRVTDEGVGIDAPDLERIFDPFYSTKLTGTGLGLALCQQIVGEHGGEVRVLDTSHQGTTIAVRLPHPQEPTKMTRLVGSGSPRVVG